MNDRGGVAQSVEHLPLKQLVVGSSPTTTASDTLNHDQWLGEVGYALSTF